ncbi:MAG: DNA methyltransferase [Chromatiaceae bacterium]
MPHLAIVPSILHYTEPGDIVLDGFAGSGMTGVAAQWCGAAPSAYRYELETEWKKQGKAAPKWGARRVILNDLSPAATFIAANYNLPFDVEAFAKAGKQLLKEVEQEIGWMYETTHTDGKTKGRIEYTVWSEVFTCPHCAGEVNFLEEALDGDSKRVKDTFPCPHCGADLNKDKLDRVLESRVDPASGEAWQRVKFRPALISFVAGGTRREKPPDENDLAVLAKIEALPLPTDLPTARFPIEQMYHGSRIAPKGFTNIHHFFLPRAAQAMALLWRKAKDQSDFRIREMLLFFVEQAIWGLSVLNRYQPIQQGRPGGSQVNRQLTGVYYVGSQHAECSPQYNLGLKLDRLGKAFRDYKTASGYAAINTGTAAGIPLPSSSIDYVFTDPPFGENIFYADLNFLVESWHHVTTDARPEAIVDKFKKKALPEYQHLMQRCFAEYYRVLKPGRWMTVVFSNSKAAVWNAIQVALQQAGFVVAEVTALDKVQGSYRQVTSTTAVKQDLVISAYKPNGGLEDRFNQQGPTVDSAWDFVQTHLKQLPAVKVTSGFPQELLNIVERDPRRIYDRMASWFIRHGAMVPLSTPEFLAELSVRCREMDGMVFLPDQWVEYEKARSRIPQVKQAELFVADERSAIDWLTHFLRKRPSTRSEIHPEYIPRIGAAKRKGEIIPELAQLLDDNFIQYDGTGEVPSQIHAYLSSNWPDLRNLDKSHSRLVAKAKDRWYVPDPNKAQDLEKKREKALLKEFDTYRSFTGRKIKESRLEVLRAGFRAAWGNMDYPTIISVANKLPPETLQEDEKLLTLYDLAMTRMEEN